MAECSDVLLAQCCPFLLPREAHIASAALPAAGAFTAQAYMALPNGTTKLTFWVTYTRGAVGGYPTFRIQWQNGTETNVHALVLDEGSLAPAQPFATMQTYEEQLIGPTPQDGNPLNYLIEFNVPHGATGARLLAAELGITATPGTLAMAATGAGSI